MASKNLLLSEPEQGFDCQPNGVLPIHADIDGRTPAAMAGHHAASDGRVSTAKEAVDTDTFQLSIAADIMAGKEDAQSEGSLKPYTLQGAGTVQNNAIGISAFALAQGNIVGGVASHGCTLQAAGERMARNDRFSSPIQQQVSRSPCRYNGDIKLQAWASLPTDDRSVSSKLQLDRHPSARLDRQPSGSLNVLDRQGSTMLGLERQHSSKLVGLARQPSNSPLSLERQPSESILAAVGQQVSGPDSPPSLDRQMGAPFRRSPGTGGNFRTTQSPAPRRSIPLGSRGAEVSGRGGCSLLNAGEGVSPVRTSSQKLPSSAAGAAFAGRMHSPAPSSSIADIVETSSLKKTASMADLSNQQLQVTAPMGRQPSSPFPLALQQEAGLPSRADCVDQKTYTGDKNLSPPATPPESAPVVGSKGVISSSSSNSSQDALCPLPSMDSCHTPEFKGAGVSSVEDTSRPGALPNALPLSPFAARMMSGLSLNDVDAVQLTDGSFSINPPVIGGKDNVRQESCTPPPIPCRVGSPRALSDLSAAPGLQDFLDERTTQVGSDSSVGDGATNAEHQRAGLSSFGTIRDLMKDMNQQGLMSDGAPHSQPVLGSKGPRNIYDAEPNSRSSSDTGISTGSNGQPRHATGRGWALHPGTASGAGGPRMMMPGRGSGSYSSFQHAARGSLPGRGRSGQRPSQPGVSMPDPQQALQARHAYLLQLVRELQSLPQNSQLMRLHQLQMALRITEQEKVAVLTAVRRQEFMFADEMRRRQAIARAGRGEGQHALADIAKRVQELNERKTGLLLHFNNLERRLTLPDVQRNPLAAHEIMQRRDVARLQLLEAQQDLDKAMFYYRTQQHQETQKAAMHKMLLAQQYEAATQPQVQAFEQQQQLLQHLQNAAYQQQQQQAFQQALVQQQQVHAIQDVSNILGQQGLSPPGSVNLPFGDALGVGTAESLLLQQPGLGSGLAAPVIDSQANPLLQGTTMQYPTAMDANAAAAISGPSLGQALQPSPFQSSDGTGAAWQVPETRQGLEGWSLAQAQTNPFLASGPPGVSPSIALTQAPATTSGGSSQFSSLFLQPADPSSVKAATGAQPSVKSPVPVLSDWSQRSGGNVWGPLPSAKSVGASVTTATLPVGQSLFASLNTPLAQQRSLGVSSAYSSFPTQEKGMEPAASPQKFDASNFVFFQSRDKIVGEELEPPGLGGRAAGDDDVSSPVWAVEN